MIIKNFSCQVNPTFALMDVDKGVAAIPTVFAGCMVAIFIKNHTPSI